MFTRCDNSQSIHQRANVFHTSVRMITSHVNDTFSTARAVFTFFHHLRTDQHCTDQHRDQVARGTGQCAAFTIRKATLTQAPSRVCPYHPNTIGNSTPPRINNYLVRKEEPSGRSDPLLLGSTLCCPGSLQHHSILKIHHTTSTSNLASI